MNHNMYQPQDITDQVAPLIPTAHDYRVLVWLTAALTLCLFFWGLGSIPWLTLNEARRAIPARHMLESGQWLIPMLNGEIYITKPPMLYWCSASLAWLLGQCNEWSARLPSALAACGIAWMVFNLAKRHFGPWAALFSVQILIANAGFAMLGRQAGIEMLLAFFCVSALFCAFKYSYEHEGRHWLRLSYALLGFAVLTKGPLALLFVTLPLCLDAYLRPNARKWQVLTDPWSWTLFLTIASSWYLAVTLQLGPEVWHATIQKDLVNKIQSHTGEPFYNYLLWILLDFFPALLLCCVVPLRWWLDIQRSAIARTMLIAVLVPVLVFSAFSDKHAKYLLPMYPWLAVLLGVQLSRWFARMGVAKQKWLCTLSLLMPVGYVVFYTVAEPKVFDYRVQALPKIAAWFAAEHSGLPILAFQAVDARLLYYAHHDIAKIDVIQRSSLPYPDMIVIAENEHIAKVQSVAQCTLNTFQPYLKRKGRLAIFGFGRACQTQLARLPAV